MLSHIVFLLNDHLLPLIQTTIDNIIFYYEEHQEPRYHEALRKDPCTVAQTFQKAGWGACAEARGLETTPRFVGGHWAPPWAPLEEAAAARAHTQHRGERQVSSGSGASLRPGLGGGLPTDNFGGEVRARVSCRRGLTLELCQFQQSYSSVTQGATFMRSDGTVIRMPLGLEISAHKGVFCLGSSWGNSDRLGWKLRGFLTLKPHKTQCQEQRDVAFLLMLLRQCLTGGGGKR